MKIILACLFSLITMSGFEATCCIGVYAGPEVYRMERIKEGGTHQEGRFDGVRVGFDRIKPLSWYFGADYLYAKGKLRGYTGTCRPQKSNVWDEIYEIRGGYTLQKNTLARHFISLFGGWGHFKETSDFVFPSTLICKYTDTFNYAVVGFLSGVNFTPLLSIGINFKIRFMLDGESNVTEDLMDDVKLLMTNTTQYRLEVPFVFSPCNSLFQWQLVPFYEFRHFGGREGFPFNFKDTKFNLYGARFALQHCF